MDTQVKSLSLQGKSSRVQIADYKLCYVNWTVFTNYVGSDMGNNMYIKNMNLFLYL